jgi:hypothetical protein
LASLRYVSKQIYESIWYEQSGRVVFLESEPASSDFGSLKEEEHCSCFLLVAEMIRNYCEYEEDDCIATWSAQLMDNVLTIKLLGPTNAQRNPASMTLARLNVFLNALGVGKAGVDWDKEQKMCAYTVEVDLSPGSVGPANVKEIAPPESTHVTLKQLH